MYKKLSLKEMPHIQYDYGEFDLEIERFKNIKNFLTYLDKIIDGKAVEDKYGNIINLRSREEKLSFIKELKSDGMFQKFVKHKLSDNERRLLNIIMRA